MKKNTLFLLVTLLFASFFLSAQTPSERQEIIAHYDLAKLQQMEARYANEFAREKQNALAMAALYGWEEFIELPNGGIAILVGVWENGAPKYLATENDGAAITTRTNKVHTGGGAGLDLNGENMIGGIWDGGRVRENHELIENRATQMDGTTTISNHSTHVAGTMIGTGTVEGGNAKGMAPLAELWAYRFDDDESEMTAAASNGLLVSNHSYGLDISQVPLWYIGYYDDNAQALDEIIYNAPYYLPVSSAGNDRQSGENPGDGGFDYLTDKATAKNNIVSAAVFEVLNYTGPSSVPMSIFSSWGPTDDGRIKPDLSAKGVNTYSSVGTSNGSYGFSSGTSMSTPNISGSLLLLQQHYNAVNGQFMLASTLRGLALHTADEAGTAPGPDYLFGWGLMNTEKAAEAITNNGTASLIIEESIDNGEVYTFSLQADGVNNLMASVTWTDPAGSPLPPGNNDVSTPSLVNDLDIRVSQDGGATFFPWKLDVADFNNPATTGDNLVDNIEKTEIAGASGEYIVRVSHKGTLTNNSQVFSLIATGIDREDFAISSHQGIREACAADGSITFEIDLAFEDGFSDTINFTVTDIPGGATASLSPTSLSADGTVTLTVNNINGLAPGDYQLKVTGTGTSQTVNVYPVLRIVDTVFSPVVLTTPADDAIDLPTNIYFIWQPGDPHTDSYDFELATDVAFTNIISSQNTMNTTVPVVSLEQETEYFWRVRSKNQCADGPFSDVFSFTTEEAMGISERAIEGLVVYPNPATTKVTVEAPSVISSVEVYDVLGQALMEQAVQGSQTQLDVSPLNSGIYFIKVVSGNAISVVRLVKK